LQGTRTFARQRRTAGFDPARVKTRTDLISSNYQDPIRIFT
jgi:hypothetical protein